MENAQIAKRLRELASLLGQQGEDGFRQNAYRRAADRVSAIDKPLSDILAEEGLVGLTHLPGIGKGIAAAIDEMIGTGQWSQLERLRGELDPERLFQTLPGIGPALAAKLAGDAHLESLEELETVLASGKKIPGIGCSRREMLRAVLAERLARQRQEPAVARQPQLPPVDLILEVDRIYRERSTKGKLRQIAPKRFNPEGKAWLSILHARHDDWHFTALYSNTRRAHELGKTRDWVVIYAHRENEPEARCTVVTETRGPMAGRRVVRGRETESAQSRAA